MQNLFEKFANGEIEKDNEDLLTLVKFMQLRYTKGNKETAIIEAVDIKEYNSILSTLRDNNIFIWSKGELENYYTPKAKAISGGKDIKALELSYLLQVETQNINELFLHVDEINLLVNLILDKS